MSPCLDTWWALNKDMKKKNILFVAALFYFVNINYKMTTVLIKMHKDTCVSFFRKCAGNVHTSASPLEPLSRQWKGHVRKQIKTDVS